MSSLSVRYFLVSDNDEIFRVPITKYQRLLKGSIEEKAERFAGKRVRAAELIVKFENRKPILVQHAVYYFLHFHENGSLDLDKYNESNGRLLEAALSDFSKKKEKNNIINAQYAFTERRLRWEPSVPLERNLLDASIDEFKCKRL